MHRRAVTLMEVILVILVIGLIIGFTFPNLGVVLKTGSLRESSDRLRSLIVMCHAEAMQEGLKYRIMFPGTPDPNDKFAEKEIDVPFETLQPEVTRQSNPIEDPEAFVGFDPFWKDWKVMQDGTRCVAVLPGRPGFGIDPGSEIAGPSISEDQAEFVPLTFNPDGTTEWVTFVLTDLPFEVEPEREHVSRIFNVIVDGRTGQTWIQRALLVDEVEVLQEHGLQPLMHGDFTRREEITEEDIYDRFWEVHLGKGGSATMGSKRGGG